MKFFEKTMASAAPFSTYHPSPRHPLSGFLLVQIAALGLFAAACGQAVDGDDNDGSLRSGKAITGFSVLGKTGAIGKADIHVKDIPLYTNEEENVVTDVRSLGPSITVSPGASVSPGSGIQRNFTGPVTYTVTAEDGSTARYTVTISLKPLTDVSAIGNYLTAAAGVYVKDTIPLPLEVDLSNDGWNSILGAINSAGVDVAVALDLSSSTGVTEFDPGTANTGESKIIFLTLPDVVTGIKAGTDTDHTFKNFTRLESVTGAGVQAVGDYAFTHCPALTTVSLPEATSIGAFAFGNCAALATVSLPEVTSISTYAFVLCPDLTTVSIPKAEIIGVTAFAGCASLTTLNIPSATSIGALAFGLTGHGDLTVTLGGTAPTLGVSIFSGVTGSTKNVTVKVPSGVSGYGTSPTDTTTANWGNGFRGGGWDGAAITNSTEINGNVNLVIKDG